MVVIELKEGYKHAGTLVVSSTYESYSASEYVGRIKALITVLKSVNLDVVTQDELYDLLDMLEDYMPTEEQAEKMFKKTEE